MESAAFVPELSPDDLRVTQPARARLAAIFSHCDDPRVEAVRVFVTGQGCAGMRYLLTFSGPRMSHDHVLDLGGFSILIDAIAFAYLRGAEIDLEQRESGETFVFRGVFRSTDGSGLCGGCAAAGA